MTSESQNLEWKESWHDDYLRWVCGFANAQGGTLVIGKKDDGTPVGAPNARRLMEELPNKMRDQLGIMADVNLVVENGMEKIRDACRSAGISDPILRTDLGGLWIEFTPRAQTIPEGSQKTPLKTPLKTPELLLQYLQEDATLSIAEIATRIRKDIATIKRAAKKLQLEGRLKRIGPDKGGRWEVTE